MNIVKIDDFEIGKSDGLFLMAGPCAIESPERAYKIGEKIQEICRRLKLPYVFKASYDKANRSSVNSFRGPGLKEGLKILAEIKKSLKVPVVSDVHAASEIELAAEVLDVIQIPAFLCRQTDLVCEAGRTGKVVNIKKGQFVSPQEMKNVIEKVLTTNNNNILLTERGFSFGYNNLVVDMRAFPIMRKFNYPVVFDATHSVQLPGANGFSSSGQREFVPFLARAAVATGIDGLFMEVHNNPDKALSDGPNMVHLDKLEELLVDLIAIDSVIKK